LEAKEQEGALAMPRSFIYVVSVITGAGSLALYDLLRSLNASIIGSVSIPALVVLVVVLLVQIRLRLEQAPSAERPESESLFEKDQREAQESERRSDEVMQDFRLFQKLGINPTDEWRLRAAKIWKLPTPQELDEEQDHTLACGQFPSEMWQLRAAMLANYRYQPASQGKMRG
jgi:hypothetical protein